MNKNQSSEVITIQSAQFGALEIPTSSIITFPQGVVGLPDLKRFVLLEYKEPFSWLHAIDDPSYAFVVVNGSQFGDSYQVRPPKNDQLCDFKPDDEFATLVIITVRSDPKLTTANLKAPLFVNLRNRTGMQHIFDDPRYSTRHPFWADENKK